MLAGAEIAFETFGRPHLATMAVIVATAAGLSVWARAARSGRLIRQLAGTIAAVLIINELAGLGVGTVTKSGGEFVRNSLPLHICDVAVFLTAWALMRRSQRAFEIAYFWGLGGTLQAVLTPDLSQSFPDYSFFQYFIGHGGIIAGVVFCVAVLGLRPAKGAVLRIMIVTNIYLVGVGLIDWLLGANYMFLCHKPEGASPFFFLDWPWYIGFLEIVALASALILYAPFYIRDKRQARR